MKRASKKLMNLGLADHVQGLHKAAVGGAVLGSRMLLKTSCDRCGAEVGTPERRYHSCPANKNIEGEDEKKWMMKTEWLV